MSKLEKDLKRDGKGCYNGAIEENAKIRIVRCLGNRAVQLAFNFGYIEPLYKCKRYFKKEKKYFSPTLLS